MSSDVKEEPKCPWRKNHSRHAPFADRTETVSSSKGVFQHGLLSQVDKLDKCISAFLQWPASCKDSKVCVVSIIGKSRYNAFTSKASVLNPILDADVFKGVEDILHDSINQGQIECYYDTDSNVIYLHYTCVHDTARLVSVSQNIKELNHKDFQSLWQSEEFHYAKSLLLLFSVSHLIVISHPGSSFDITWIRLFRTLDSIRLKLQKCITDQLYDFPVSKDWKLNARPCSPRVLFIFETCSIDTFTDEQEVAPGGFRSSRPQQRSPLKRLQIAMEDQIYKLLRKSRVITNISNNSLFAVPANQEFVFIQTNQSEAADPVSYYLQQLCLNGGTKDSETDSPRSRSYQTSRRTVTGPSERSRSTLSRNGGENSFKEFLWQHIEMALTKGFDDNVGRHPVQANFELAASETWFEVASVLHQFFFAPTLDPKAQPHFNTLKSLLETDIRFSENRCNKVLPVAESSYQENLPTHYVTSYHLRKLVQAKQVFSQIARGPACEKYMKQLEESCDRYWKNGRQLCEEVSLLGNHCVNPLHRTEDQPVTDDTAHLPVSQHSSQLKMKAACNCGRKQADKDDPFDHKAANYDFYESLEKSCCNNLEHYKFPVFEPSTTDIRAALLTTLAASPRGKIQHKLTPRDTPLGKAELVTGTTSLSLALSLGQSEGGSDLYGHGGQSNCSPLPDHESTLNPDQTDALKSASPPPAQPQGDSDLYQTDRQNSPLPDQDETSHLDQSDVHKLASPQGHTGESSDPYIHGEQSTCSPFHDQETVSNPDQIVSQPPLTPPTVSPTPTRQHSTTEYLPGMIHTESPPGLLPKFPSWSLCCLGKASFYNHSSGLDLPGFLGGSNFLLPWDVTVRAEKDKWPAIGEAVCKKSKQKRAKQEISEMNLRVFLGEEYECPRGHRFFCSGPEKIIKVSSTSTVKDNANKLINMDMPLYCPCHCRSSKGYMAQLMRIYMVTPEGPLRVSVNPLIQPAPHPCPIFHPGTGGEIDLTPGSVWVLRLPSIYMGDHGPYTMPADPTQVPACRLLKGIFNFKEIVAE